MSDMSEPTLDVDAISTEGRCSETADSFVLGDELVVTEVVEEFAVRKSCVDTEECVSDSEPLWWPEVSTRPF